jgi:hypothetical protein
MSDERLAILILTKKGCASPASPQTSDWPVRGLDSTHPQKSFYPAWMNAIARAAAALICLASTSAIAGPVAETLQHLKQVVAAETVDPTARIFDASFRSEASKSGTIYWLCGKVIAHGKPPRAFIATLNPDDAELFPFPEVTAAASDQVGSQCRDGFTKYSRGDDVDKQQLQQICARAKYLSTARVQQTTFDLKFMSECKFRGTEHPFAAFDE